MRNAGDLHLQTLIKQAFREEEDAFAPRPEWIEGVVRICSQRLAAPNPGESFSPGQQNKRE